MDITEGVQSNKGSTIYSLCWLKQEGSVVCTSGLPLQVTWTCRLDISVSQTQQSNSPQNNLYPPLRWVSASLSSPLAQNDHEDVTELGICFLYESCALPSCNWHLL